MGKGGGGGGAETRHVGTSGIKNATILQHWFNQNGCFSMQASVCSPVREGAQTQSACLNRVWNRGQDRGQRTGDRGQRSVRQPVICVRRPD